MFEARPQAHIGLRQTIYTANLAIKCEITNNVTYIFSGLEYFNFFILIICWGTESIGA